MRSLCKRRLALGLLIAGLGGCGRADLGEASSGAAKSDPGATAGVGVEPEASVGPAVTDEECRAFAATIADAVATGNIAAFDAAIDWDAILRTATAGIQVQEESRRGFVQGVKSSMQQEQGLVPQILATVRGGGSYRLLHRRARDKHKTALFRLVTSDSNGLNYHEFVLGRRPDGKVRAVDVYIFLSGELLSQTMRRMYIPVAAQVSRGLLGRLMGTEQAFMKNLPRFQQMTAEVRGGKPAEALRTYEQFPPELKTDKNILLLRLQAAQDVGEEEYSRAIEDLRAAHPGDACIDMISIDGYLLKKDYPRAFACIDRIEKAVGGDPYLNIMRANIHIEEGRYDAARQDARRAIAQDPTLQDAYWTLVTIALREHDFAETVALLDQLAGRFQIPFNDMTQMPVFAEFVRSPEYRAWKERSKPDGPEPTTPEAKATPAPAPSPSPGPETPRDPTGPPGATP